MALFRELRQRGVVRTATLYVVAAWLILQVADILFDAFELPAWAMRVLIVVLFAGLLVTAVVSWFFEITPDGLKREAELGVDRPRPASSRFNAAIVVLLILAAGVLAVRQLVAPQEVEPAASLEQAVPERSIAILPFVNLSDDPANDYFSDGLAEELLNTLAGVPELSVSARTSSFAFRGRDQDVRAIGEQLGVAHVLEGSVRKSGDSLRVAVQLVNARTGFELWSATYDRTLDDVFVVQDEIATRTARALVDSLVGFAPIRPTDPEAFNAYLLALHFYRQGSAEGYDNALVQLRRAVEIDPDYAPAWNLMGSVYANQSLTGQIDFDEGHEKAMVVVGRALELAPENAFANSSRAWLAMTYERDYATSAAYFRRALRYSPGNPVILGNAAVLARTLDRVDKAIAMTQQSIELNPISATAYVNLADQLSRVGRLEEMIAAAQHAVDLAPDSVVARSNLGLAYVLAEQPERAIAELAELEHDFYRLYVGAAASQLMGDSDGVEAALQTMIADYGSRRAFNIATVYAFRNDVEEAFAWLERAVDEGQPTLGIRNEPMLATLHDDPRWDPLLARVGLSDAQVAAVDF